MRTDPQYFAYPSISSTNLQRQAIPKKLAAVDYHNFFNNACLKRLAKSQRIAEREIPEDAESSSLRDLGMSPEEMVGQRQVSETVDAALNRLSVQDRGMIVMRYREDFTDTEIAQAVSMPVGTVKTRLYRARARLKRYLEPLFREVVS